MNHEEFSENFNNCFIENLPFSDYLKVKALSNSGIENLLKSPAHYKWYEANPKKATESMQFGKLVHCAVLEPHNLKSYVARPEGMKFNVKEGKDWKALMVQEGYEVVEKVDLEMAIRIAADLSSIKEGGLSEAIQVGKKEFSVFWMKDGIKCKARPDIYVQEIATAIDLKTTNKPDNDGFEKLAWYGGYHRKAAWYKEGLEANGLPCKHFLYIAIENDDYSDFRPYYATEEIIRVGQMQNDEVLEVFKKCSASGEWPGYSRSISPLSFPSWVINTLPERYLK